MPFESCHLTTSYSSSAPSSFDYERFTEADIDDIDDGREMTYAMMFDPEYSDRYNNADY